MHLKLKILLGFLILTSMLFIAGVVSIYELNKIGSSIKKLLDDNYKSINAGRMMLEALEREDSAILLLLLGKWEEGRSIIETADSLFQHNYAIARRNLTIPGEETHLDSIRVSYGRYKKLWLKPVVGTQKEGNLDWYFQRVHKAFTNVRNSVSKLMVLNDHIMYQTASELKHRSNRAIMPGIVAIISALIFTFVFNYFINYYITSPLIKIIRGIKAFITKKVPYNVEIDTNDELFELSSAIADLCERASVISETDE